jgi:hypothetical protein
MACRGPSPPPPAAALAAAASISVGGAFAFAALGALVEAATELRDQGSYGYPQRARRGVEAARGLPIQRLTPARYWTSCRLTA